MRVNSLLVRSTFGWSNETLIEDGALVIEGLEGLGTQASPQEASRVAQARLAVEAVEQQSVTVGIEPAGIGDTPMSDYRVGDTVQLDGTAERVVEITGSRTTNPDTSPGDPRNLIVWTPTLRAVEIGNAEALDRAARKMIPGTGQGAYQEATPIDAIIRKGNPADPIFDTVDHFKVRLADAETVGAGTTVGTWGDVVFDGDSGSSTIDGSGRVVPTRLGMWQLIAVANAFGQSSTTGRVVVRIINTGAGIGVTGWGYWHDTGDDIESSVTVGTNLPIGADYPQTFAVTVTNEGAGACDVFWELSAHFIAPHPSPNQPA